MLGESRGGGRSGADTRTGEARLAQPLRRGDDARAFLLRYGTEFGRSFRAIGVPGMCQDAGQFLPVFDDRARHLQQQPRFWINPGAP